MTRKPKRPLTDDLRAAILACGQSQNALCKLADIDPANMSRFLHGEQNFSLAAADRIAQVLGLRIVVTDQTKGG